MLESINVLLAPKGHYKDYRDTLNRLDDFENAIPVLCAASNSRSSHLFSLCYH